MGRNTLCWAMSQYRSWKWFPFPRSAVGIKASTCYLVVQLSLTAWAGNLCTFKCLRARNKAPASLPFCWHPAFTESRRGAVSVPDSGLPHTWGALMLAEVCSSPRGFCWGSIYSFSHMAIKHLSAPAVLSRAWLCAVTGAGQLCLNTSPRVPSWLLQMVWTSWLMESHHTTGSHPQDMHWDAVVLWNRTVTMSVSVQCSLPLCHSVTAERHPFVRLSLTFPCL